MKLSSIIPRDFQRERSLRLFVFQNFLTEISLILIPFLDCHWFEILRDKVHVEQSPLSLSLLVYHRPPNCGVASCVPSKRFPSYQLFWSFKEGYVKGNVKGGNETKIPESFFFVYMKTWTIFIWHLQVQYLSGKCVLRANGVKWTKGTHFPERYCTGKLGNSLRPDGGERIGQ